MKTLKFHLNKKNNANKNQAENTNKNHTESANKNTNESGMTVQYKTETFTCLLSFPGKFRDQLQEVLDRNAREGWKLHSWQVPGASASYCVVVFYKEGRAEA